MGIGGSFNPEGVTADTIVYCNINITASFLNKCCVYDLIFLTHSILIITNNTNQKGMIESKLFSLFLCFLSVTTVPTKMSKSALFRTIVVNKHEDRKQRRS